MSACPRVLLSLHDVAPVHRERVERAEVLFRELGVERVAYLLIPDYHGRGRSDEPWFAAWCRRERPFEVEWLLHGYYHLEDARPEALGPLSARLQRRYATAGEGEFLALGEGEMRERLRRGREVFRRTLGAEPEGFVPPAWLHAPGLPGALAAEGFRFWESRRGVHELAGGRAHEAPVITWATRTPLRKWTSIAGTPALGALWRRRPLLRLALHPFDFDHPETVASIRRVGAAVLGAREQSAYGREMQRPRNGDMA